MSSKYTVAPVINPPIPRTLLSFEGSSLTVPCTYTGHPQPTPSWCRLDNNGNCVKSASSSNCPDFTPMDDGQFTYILVISNLQSCHSGGYQCSVSNTVDKAIGQFQLTVQGTKLALLLLINFQVINFCPTCDSCSPIVKKKIATIIHVQNGAWYRKIFTTVPLIGFDISLHDICQLTIPSQKFSYNFNRIEWSTCFISLRCGPYWLAGHFHFAKWIPGWNRGRNQGPFQTTGRVCFVQWSRNTCYTWKNDIIKKPCLASNFGNWVF